MHGLRIKLEDVRELDEVDYIAVATLNGRGDFSRRLTTDRLIVDTKFNMSKFSYPHHQFTKH